MLAYPLAEADELLQSKLNAAQSSLATCEEDLDFLREQITVSSALSSGCPFKTETNDSQTMEVATARVYNWDVAERRKERGESGKAESQNKMKISSSNGS